MAISLRRPVKEILGNRLVPAELILQCINPHLLNRDKVQTLSTLTGFSHYAAEYLKTIAEYAEQMGGGENDNLVKDARHMREELLRCAGILKQVGEFRIPPRSLKQQLQKFHQGRPFNFAALIFRFISEPDSGFARMEGYTPEKTSAIAEALDILQQQYDRIIGEGIPQQLVKT